MSVVKIKYDSNKNVDVWIYVCEKHGSSSEKPFKCPCLDYYPNYVYTKRTGAAKNRETT